MAKRSTSAGRKSTKTVSTPVRNTAIPRVQSASVPAKKEITHEMIAERAYYLWQAQGGSSFENWLRAERELRGE